MKLEDVPVPISEGLRVQIGTADLLRGYIPALMHSHVSLERKLSLAVAALESVAVDSQERFIRNVARAALAQIEEGK